MTNKQDAVMRVEAAMPSFLAIRVVGMMVPDSDEDAEFLRSAIDGLMSVAMEPVAHLDGHKRSAHMRRCDRLCEDMLSPYYGRGGMTVYAASQALFQTMINGGILPAPEVSAFYEIWGSLGDKISSSGSHAADWENCQRSAVKMAVKWIEWLNGRGYYL